MLCCRTVSILSHVSGPPIRSPAGFPGSLVKSDGLNSSLPTLGVEVLGSNMWGSTKLRPARSGSDDSYSSPSSQNTCRTGEFHPSAHKRRGMREEGLALSICRVRETSTSFALSLYLCFSLKKSFLFESLFCFLKRDGIKWQLSVLP